MNFSHLSKSISSSHLITKIDQRSLATASGQDIIDLSIAEANLYPPNELIEAFSRNLRNDKLNAYVASSGIDALKSLMANWANEDYQINTNPDNIVVSAGARGSLFAIMQAILNPGDEVILFSPYWSGYPNQIKLIGAIPKIIALDKDDSFSLEINDLKHAFNSRTKMIIINNPHNPTSIIWDENTISQILLWAKEKNIFVVSDEVCAVEIFNENTFTPTAKIVQSYENLAVVRSFSKNLSIPGWRIGWTITNKVLAQKMALIQSSTLGGVHSTLQYALVEAWEAFKPWMQSSLRTTQERMEMLYNCLNKIHGFRTLKAQAGLTLFTDVQYYLGKELAGTVPKDADHFTEIIFEKTGVLLSSGENFGIGGFVRFCFTQDQALLKKATEKIIEILQ